MEETEKKLQKLEEEHTKKVNSLFMMCLEILLIFGIPAFTVLVLYKLIFTDERLFIVVGLPASFFLSWVIFIIRWKKISTEVTQLEADLKQARSEARNSEKRNITEDQDA